MLAGQDLQKPAEWADRKSNNALSQLRDIVAKIEATKQTIQPYLGSAISRSDHTGSNVLHWWLNEKEKYFFIESSYMVSK